MCEGLKVQPCHVCCEISALLYIHSTVQQGSRFQDLVGWCPSHVWRLITAGEQSNLMVSVETWFLEACDWEPSGQWGNQVFRAMKLWGYCQIRWERAVCTWSKFTVEYGCTKGWGALTRYARWHLKVMYSVWFAVIVCALTKWGGEMIQTSRGLQYRLLRCVSLDRSCHDVATTVGTGDNC